MKLSVEQELPSTILTHMTAEGPKAVNLVELIAGKKVVLIGMPGAFTKTCSTLHLPGYIKNYELTLEKGISKIICIAVNDPNVMKAWGEKQSVGTKIFMVGDPYLNFTKAIGAEVDKSEKGLGIRSNRYTMLVENGNVKKIEEEKETAACELSGAESFLNTI